MMLIGYADTEGGTNDSNTIWDLAIIFKHVINNSKTEDIFHVCNFTHSKHASDIKRPLKNFENSIKYLMKHHKCDKLILIFWNKSHDVSVLKRARFALPFIPLCLMKYYGKQKLNGDHTALGDVQKMISLDTDIDKLLKQQYYSTIDPFDELAATFESSVKITDVIQTKKKTLIEQAIEKSIKRNLTK